MYRVISIILSIVYSTTSYSSSAIDQSLWDAAGRGRLDIVKELVEIGANVNYVEPSINKQHILFTAVKSKNTNLVKYLLEKGCDPNGTDVNNTNPINLAILNSNIQMVKVLIQAGTNLDNFGPAKYNYPPLSYAIKTSNKEIAELLLEKGANPSIIDHDKWVPLVHAIARGYQDLVLKLMIKGADTKITGPNKTTLLMVASGHGMEKVVDYLIKNKKANVNAKSNSGATALSIAAQNGHIDIIKLLKKHGAIQ